MSRDGAAVPSPWDGSRVGMEHLALAMAEERQGFGMHSL